jgi:homocitrate synthase NifV
MSKPTWIDQTLNAAIRRQFTSEQLADVASLLSRLGIQQAGICLPDWQRYRPELSGVQHYLKLCGMIDLAVPELEWLEQAGIEQVVVGANAVSPDFTVKLEAVMLEAVRRGLEVTLLLEGLAKLDLPEMLEVVSRISSYPLAGVIYGDKEGNGDSLTTFEQITALKNSLHCPIGIQASNGYGLATANTLAAMKAGVRQVVTAVAGVGGFAPWEEALMVAKQLAKIDIEIPPDLANGCQRVVVALRLTIPEDKAVIGPAIFSHESGLHVDGVNKDPWLYEPYAPELVGLSRRLIIGKHSGTTALKTKFAAWGIRLEEVESKKLLASVRALSVRKKSAISDEELQRLYLSS